ncbi:hypothetical protein [Methylomicrobium sp. Wu6]|uniref:hypothetical protein n=1 Tax=Methylomicrobium sp. Wu6 TaxID=3107928 RepID=UPI002DD68CE4|nr:hypothetical protein [Methylomicrobium sp. Wu6]MEC4748298.1 hypothetical protein [Methylomicrobium sp. Wu6]
MITLICSLNYYKKYKGNFDMAKNLLEQFLDFATSKLTGPIGDDIYMKEKVEVNSELTGVARYLAKQEQAAQAAAVTMTGVAKYLAKQAQVAQPAEQESAAPMSRVDRYLASQAAAKPAAAKTVAEPAVAVREAAAQEPTAPLSRVARYLASQAEAKPAAAAEAAAEPVATIQETAAPLSRVAKYLASQQAESTPATAEAIAEKSVAAAHETVAEESGAPASRVAKYLAAISKEFKPNVAVQPEVSAAESEVAPAPRSRVSKYLESQNKAVAEPAGIASVAQVAKVEAPVEDESVGGSDDIIRIDDGKQCQASTAKGTQCRNKANLGHIQLTVNDKKYQFSVCTQHNSDSFTPFADLLES